MNAPDTDLPPLAILAGGLATRLKPLTETIPKSLVEVNDEPFLAHQLALAHAQGFRRIVMLVGHLGEQIVAFAGDGCRFGVDIRYVFDGDHQRGTGGALRQALPELGDTFFVTYGDSYLDVDVRPVYRAFAQSGALALMTVFLNDGLGDPSNVVFEGNRVLVHDKSDATRADMRWIDFGLSVFRSAVIAEWPEPDPLDLVTITKALAQRGLLAGHEVHQRFYEIGKPQGLAETAAYLARRCG